jgi:hypothetical protein
MHTSSSDNHHLIFWPNGLTGGPPTNQILQEERR